MYKHCSYGYVMNQKGASDSYSPPEIQSMNYKNWISTFDFKLCAVCRSNHGKIYKTSENPKPSPPIHKNCRCIITAMKAVNAGYATKNGQNGADWYLKYFNQLPSYYINKLSLMELGWNYGDKPSKYAPGKMFTNGIYKNKNGHLPNKPGRIWYEADINYTPGKRNKHRIVWSNDGLIFVTYDHYETFYEIV